MRGLFIAITLMLAAAVTSPTIAKADAGLIVKSSPYSVPETLDRLEAIFKKKGLTVFTRIDHAAGAARVNMDLAPTQVLIFGNPKLGTPLMQSQPEVAIALPLKAVAWQDKAGKVWLGYTKPSVMASRFGITDRPGIIKKMTGALNKLTNAALKK